MNREQIISALDLEQHIEGGWFRRTWQSPAYTDGSHEQALASSIYYLLTSDAPIGHLHINRSDILHFFHCGEPIQYTLIDPNGQLHQPVMGSDPSRGELLQMVVPGGWWKASELNDGDYGLISEVVVPEFRYEEMVLATHSEIKACFAGLYPRVSHLIQEPS